jgi:protein ImuA
VLDANGPTLSEVFATIATDAAAPGFIMAHLPREARPILWIQDRLSQREAGRPYLAGLAEPPELLCLTVNRAVDVLWAMEQGLGCSALAAVVGEVWGDAPALDFTASKRLALRAEAQATPGWLLRRAASPDLSAARARWRLSSAPSASDPYDPRAPGSPRWQAELFRARWQTPGTWLVNHEQGKMQFEAAAAPHAPPGPTAAQA